MEKMLIYRDRYVSKENIQNVLDFINKNIPISIGLIILLCVFLVLIAVLKIKGKKINKILIICTMINLVGMIAELLGTILITREMLSF